MVSRALLYHSEQYSQEAAHGSQNHAGKSNKEAFCEAVSKSTKRTCCSEAGFEIVMEISQYNKKADAISSVMD